MSDPITDGKIETTCRCCGIALRVPEEDALDLCWRCLQGKGGDTNEPCAVHGGITPAYLKDLKALCDAATPEPWHCGRYPLLIDATMSDGRVVNVAAVGYTQRDAAFIRAARTAMPRLIAEVERLREGLEAHDDYCPVCGGERKAATHD